MPIKVRYEIFDSHHKASILETWDRTVASIEFNDLLRKGGDVYRLQQTPMPDGALTKQEEYLMLVYRVRKLWKRYFNQGRSQEVMMASLEQEKKLDDWNTRTAAFISSHPDYTIKMNDKAFSFYLVVSEWRKAWKERKRYKGNASCDQDVLKEIGKKCRDFEKQIDEYISKSLGLI